MSDSGREPWYHNELIGFYAPLDSQSFAISNLHQEMPGKLTRIALVSSDKCKPKKCRQECKKSCPVVRMGNLCIEVNPKSKVAFISEDVLILHRTSFLLSFAHLISCCSFALAAVFVWRNALLKRSISSIYQKISKATQPIVTVLIPLSCIGTVWYSKKVNFWYV